MVLLDFIYVFKAQMNIGIFGKIRENPNIVALYKLGYNLLVRLSNSHTLRLNIQITQKIY